MVDAIKPLLLVWIMVLGAGISLSLNADPVSAQWQAYQVRFRYYGFTTDYTCDGIRSKVKILIRAMGARDDVRIESSCYSSYGETQPFHNLLVAFALPVIADSADITAETFPAEWREVRLSNRHPRSLDGGDCELVEQFIDQVLPLVNAREIQDRTRCIPHQRIANSPFLVMTLLVPLEETAIKTIKD